MQYLDAISKTTEGSLFISKANHSISVIQVYAPTSNAEEAEVERFYENLQDLLELTPKKDILFILGDWNAKVGSQETPGVTGKTLLAFALLHSAFQGQICLLLQVFLDFLLLHSSPL